jgi:hypothetical protein
MLRIYDVVYACASHTGSGYASILPVTLKPPLVTAQPLFQPLDRCVYANIGVMAFPA